MWACLREVAGSSRTMSLSVPRPMAVTALGLTRNLKPVSGPAVTVSTATGGTTGITPRTIVGACTGDGCGTGGGAEAAGAEGGAGSAGGGAGCGAGGTVAAVTGAGGAASGAVVLPRGAALWY